MDVDAALRRESKSEAKRLDSSEIDKLMGVIRLLVKNAPGFLRQWKAEQLVAATGRQVEELTIVCDLRPVFDMSRTAVEGMMIVNTMHVRFTGEDGLPRDIDLRLDEKQLTGFRDKLNTAVAKTEVLRKLLDEKTLPLVPIDEEGS